jgi:hypothetical protein
MLLYIPMCTCSCDSIIILFPIYDPVLVFLIFICVCVCVWECVCVCVCVHVSVCALGTVDFCDILLINIT